MIKNLWGLQLAVLILIVTFYLDHMLEDLISRYVPANVITDSVVFEIIRLIIVFGIAFFLLVMMSVTFMALFYEH